MSPALKINLNLCILIKSVSSDCYLLSVLKIILSLYMLFECVLFLICFIIIYLNPNIGWAMFLQDQATNDRGPVKCVEN